MTKIKGKVSIVSGKPWNGVMLHSFKIEGDERWYRLGRVSPPFQSGDEIEFEERNSNVSPETISIAANGLAVAPVAASTPSGPTVSQPPVNNRIRYQAARRDAANLVVAALHTDALPWASNVAKAKKLDLLTDYVEQVTKTLLKQEDENAA